jgi:DNA mismatch repair ATPase MutL
MPKEKIYVSKKILADIGRGIYRTPANAIKELVSNAFDACATWIKITTNAPYFDIFTCEDNGEGMIPDELKQILKRIGSSKKKSEQN